MREILLPLALAAGAVVIGFLTYFIVRLVWAALHPEDL